MAILALNVKQGQPLSGVVQVVASVDVATWRVLFFLDGKQMGEDTAAPFTWSFDTTTVADGPHQIIAQARKGGKVIASTTVTVAVDNVVVGPGVYQGARINGAFYAKNSQKYGSVPDDDAPWSADLHPGSWDLYEQHTGKRVSSIHWGGSASAWPPKPFSKEVATKCWNRGAFSEYSWGTNLAGCRDLLADNATAHTNIGALARQIKAWGKPIMVRPLWEFNLATRFPWGANSFSPSQHATMFRNFVNIFRDEGVTNVSFVWCPNNFQSGGVPNPTPWYPGDAFPDWLGVDAYLKGSGYYRTPEQVFGLIYKTLRACNTSKPISIGETGVQANVGAPGKAAFIKDWLGTWLPNHPGIKHFSWFNDDGDTPGVQIEVGNGTGVLGGNAQAAFREWIASPYYYADVTSKFPPTGKIPVPS